MLRHFWLVMALAACAARSGGGGGGSDDVPDAATDTAEDDRPAIDVPTVDAVEDTPPRDAMPDGQRCVRDMDCAELQVCDVATGACMALSCTPGRATCVSTTRLRTCDARGTSYTETVCPAGCTDGACLSCTAPAMLCAGACVDTQTSGTHCGRCGNACLPGVTCASGVCGCLAGQSTCGGACVNLNVDPVNCGRCGNACPGGSVCSGGVCLCAAGMSLCGSACVELMTNTSHCGRCGNACPASATCAGGTCSCAAGRSLCSGVCVDTRSDVNNCGVCGRACASGQSCTAGTCASTTCSTGRTDCAGVCADLQTNVNHCGACGHPCATGQACTSGTCACVGGQTLCGTRCTTLTADPFNCNACGNVCMAGGVCTSGTCACPTGATRCGSACTNLTNDPNNCGACGAVCASGMLCVSGTCSTAVPMRYVRSVSAASFVTACGAPGAVMALAGADDQSVQVPLGFPFRYWATSMSAGAMVNFCSNGFISLDGVSNASLGGSVPSTTTPNATIAAFWGDNMNRGAQCALTLGSAPNRQQVFQWNDAEFCCSEAPLVHTTYEIILNESGIIDVLYDRMDGPRTQTVGIENQSGTLGVSGCADGTSFSCAPTTGQRVRYLPTP